MKIYHGSYIKVEKIDLSKCRPNRDFGRGFYVTKFKHHAENWAKIIGRIHKTEGAVSEFEYHENSFTQSICKIKHFEGYNEEWLDFVVMNRNENNLDFTHNYDIIEGPVANDKVQNRIDEYLEGKIPKTVFLEELKYHEETHQICFCTLNSLQTIIYVDKTNRRYITDISEPIIETLMLEKNIDEIKATDIFYASGTFAKLANETTEIYKKTWQEIYEILKNELNINNKIIM